MPDYLAAVGGGELVGFNCVFDRIAVVNDVGQSSGVAAVGAYCDVTVI